MRFKKLPLACVLIPFLSIAQLPHKVVNWNVDKGLTQGTVYSILEDKKGFLWFTSDDGLNRFDGNYFRTFQSSLTDTRENIIGVETIGLVEDSLHNIWIGSDEGLNRFDIERETFTHFVNPRYSSDGLSNFIIPFLANDQEVWCLEINGDITAYNIHNDQKRIVFPQVGWSVNYKRVLEATWDKNAQALWMPSDDGLLKISANGEKQYFFKKLTAAETKQPNIYSLAIDDRQHCIWAGTSSGLFKKHFSSDVFECVAVPGYNVNIPIGDILIDRDGRLWLGTEDHGIVIWPPGGKTREIARNKSSNSGLSSDHVAEIYFDKKNIVWVSSGFTGVDQLSQNPITITSYTQSSLLAKTSNSNVIRTLAHWPDNRIAAGTEDSGIFLLDPSTDSIRYLNTENTPALLSNYVSFTKAIPHTSKVLIGSHLGLQLYDIAAKKFKPLHFKLTDTKKTDSVYVKHFEAWGDEWIIGTQNAGAFRYRYGRDTAYQLAGTEGSHIHYVGKMKEGALLVYWDKRAELFSEDNGEWTKRPFGLDHITILYCYHDVTRNEYWFGTPKGLRHTDGKFKVIKDYSTKNGLPNNFVYAVIPDANGFFWLSTNRGVSRFDPQHEIFYNLSPADGLQGFEYNSKACLIDAGIVYFGGMNGFDKIICTSSAPVTHPPVVYLKSAAVNDTPLSFQDLYEPLDLSHDLNNLSFTIGIIDFFNTSNLSVAYKLDGANDTWKITEPGNLKINFASLEPGRYTLKVKSYSRLLKMNETSIDIPFVLSPPFWEAWWFLLAIFCIAFGIIYLFMMVRWREKIKILSIRDNLSKDLHDDIGGTLSSIRIYTEMLHQRPTETSLLTLIQENVILMLDKLEVITWASNPKHDVFKNLIKEMEHFVIPLFHSNKIAYAIDTQHIPLTKSISGHIRQHLFLIFKETVNNIIKHAGCTNVLISIKRCNKQLIMIIQDNGRGFVPDISSRRNGLKNMEHRAKKLMATLSVASNEKGTVVTLTMPYPVG